MNQQDVARMISVIELAITNDLERSNELIEYAREDLLTASERRLSKDDGWQADCAFMLDRAGSNRAKAASLLSEVESRRRFIRDHV